MDAATRFYERSHIENARRSAPALIEPDSRLAAGHRYTAAYRYLRANPGKKVVELGYGGPTLLPRIASVAGEYHIIDIVDRAAGELPANVFAKVGNLDNDWPYDTGEFDAVLAMMIIEHLYDPFHSFSELARILKPGGIAFVNLPNIASIKCRLQLLRGQMPVTSSGDWFDKREWDGNHLHYFTVADVRRIAELSGLSVTGMHAVGGGLWLKSLRPSLFCHEITYVLARR